MTDPTPPRTQRLNQLVAASGIQLQLDPDDSRLESLRFYQHWTPKDLNTLSGITEFSEIMCAVEWLEKALTVDLEALVSSLYLYGLEPLTVYELLTHVGVPADLLESAMAVRTVAEYVQTTLNAFRLQPEYRDDPVATGQLIQRLQTFADRKDVPLVEPDGLCQAANALHHVLLAQGYQTVELGLTLRSQTTVGGVPLDSLSETLSFRVHQTATGLRVTVGPATGRNTVLAVTYRVDEPYIGGLDALQMQALETALRDRTQAILANNRDSEATAVLKRLLSDVWSTYLLPFQVYASRSAAEQQQHNQRLQPLVTFMIAALWQPLEDAWHQPRDQPLTLVTVSQQVIKADLQDRLENAVYSYDRLAYLAHDVAQLIIQARVAEAEFQWTEAQNDDAKADGWLIYDVGHASFPERGRVRLQAFDRSRFETDEQAWRHVVQQSRQDSPNRCSQALAYLQAHAPQEHRRVWVSAYTHLVQAALQTPEPFFTWLQTQKPPSVIGWQPLAVFLQSLGVQRSQVTDDHVWLYYWDETDPLPVLGLDGEGQPLADAPMPQWLIDFDAVMVAMAKDTEAPPRVWTVFNAVGGILPD